MFPTSRTTNAQQHAQRLQLPSIIRTRSQQPHPLPSVDLSASPLKEAIRSHNHNHKVLTSHHTKIDKHRENVRSPSMETSDDDADELLLSPSHKKRASSPSFMANGHAEKRVRVFGQSTKANSLNRRHSEESLGTPRKESTHSPANGALSLKRTVSSGSPGKAIVHLDLTKVPQSPSKPAGSPSKILHITVDGGRMMRVPVTPRRQTSNPEGVAEPRTPGALPRLNSTPAEFRIHVNGPPHISNPQPTSVQQSNPAQMFPDQDNSQAYLPNGFPRGHGNNTINVPPSVSFHPQTTPILPKHLGNDLFFGGSPLTPLPPTPHSGNTTLSRRAPPPQSASNLGVKSLGPLLAAAPSTSSESAKASQPSPSKSRIPVPTSTSTSRLSRPPSSLSVSDMATAGPSKLTRSPRHRPMKSKPKINRKPKADVRSRAPITRLAAKRGIRRTSSLGTGLHAVISASTGTNVALPPSGDTGIMPVVDKKNSLVTSSHTSAENVVIPRAPSLLPHPPMPSASPAKPTPLSALSTALQKLLATPPAAPTRRPRPNTSLGFSRPNQVVAPTVVSQPVQLHKGPAAIRSRTPGSAQLTDAGIQRPQTSMGHQYPSGTPNALGRMGLPVRRPVSTTGIGGLAPTTGALFASKRTSLSTVPASPARSVVASAGNNASPGSRAPRNEVLDVDAWVPPAPTDNGRRKAEPEEQMANVEYIVPVVDESRTARQPPPQLISPSRRASQASLSLTQSLSLPSAPSEARHGIVRSASTSTAVSYNPRTPVKTRGRTRPVPPEPEPSAHAKQTGPMAGKRSNARMPGSLDVLKDCVIFVDVRTEEGEDAGALFIDMLRGLGARILAKPGKSCTHLVYKDGSALTITKYKLLPDPRPLPVSIGWVVECVEKREHVDETRFLVNIDEIGIAGGAQRRRSMQPKQMRTMTLGQLDSGQAADISVRADSSLTSEEPSTSGLILDGLSPRAISPSDNLPPLERARQRSLHLSRG